LGYISVAECLGTGMSSTTFRQGAPEAAEFGEITQNKGHYAVEVIQGHRFRYRYQSTAHIRLSISD